MNERRSMKELSVDDRFTQAYRRLAGVRLNPRRHTAANALAHSEAVAARAVALARANDCTEAEIRLLGDLGRAHDIGKITGTARPERSLEVLRECGIDDPPLLALVKWHDTSLPWYRSSVRGQAPTGRAWRGLASEVDIRLLSIFMVADRVDAPAGWRCNAPTVWFLAEARSRGLLPALRLDLPDQPSEVGAGGALVRECQGSREVLVFRGPRGSHELPQGGIEWDELPEEAAVRRLREEVGANAALQVGPELGHLEHLVGDGADRHLKRVRYFACTPPRTGPLPAPVGKGLWLRADQVERVDLVCEALRPLLRLALGDRGTRCSPAAPAR
jgi:ADP-ribose pyrophosphatase YjhB (NUDIX family)